ncbi:MAG: hypothetical protein KGI38_07515 [Thaumarchaeota archaeon]|nr:hypothetical protein [Nitrososphaerota archaeon]
MFSKKIKAVAVGLVALSIVGLFLVPVVTYSQSVNIWYAYKNGVRTCSLSGGIINATNEAAYARCLASYKYPPANITGYSSISYRLMGIGFPPYPAYVLVTQGNFSALAYFSGTKLIAAEGICCYANTTVDPPNVIAIQNVTFGLTNFGLLNVTVSLKNIGQAQVTRGPIGSLDPEGRSALVSIEVPGYGTNSSQGGLTWIGANFLGACSGGPLSPGSTCAASGTVPDTLPYNRTFTYYIEVQGFAGGNPFIYREGFQGHRPSSGVDSAWVGQFIGAVDKARGGVTLSENSTLDRFASLRFSTAVSQPDISDYGLSADTASFLPGSGASPMILELLFFPGSSGPLTYATELQQIAPGHWSALTNTAYSQFGYFIGSGPYEFVNLPCPVLEVPSAGINITQYFEQAGCTVGLQQTTWLVIILGK